MSLKGLFQSLEGNGHYRRLAETLQEGGQVAETWVPPAARPFLIAALWDRLGIPILLTTSRPEDARRLHEQLVTYLGAEGCSPVDIAMRRRMRGLFALDTASELDRWDGVRFRA